MKKRWNLPVVFLCLFMITALIFPLIGCYQPGGLIPENPKPPVPRAWTPGQVNAKVVMEEETIHSPAPRDNGEPPAVADDIHFLRFRLRASSLDPADADAVLVLMPGFICGANAFEYLGRQMVYMAKVKRNTNLEVWATERRSNTLEDQVGLDAAEAAGDVNIALDYYFHGVPVNGRTFEGFIKSENAPYLSEFGLRLLMDDIYKVITTKIPDPETRRRKVFLGGHSLGGILTGFFAGWDFDGDPATTGDAGYRNIAGCVALDSFILATADALAPTRESLYKITGDPRTKATDEESYVQTLEGLRDGSVPRILPIPAITPDAMLMLELLGMKANWAPEEESTLLEQIPVSPDLDLLTRIIHSRDLDNFLLGVPKITDFRYTNEAQLGAVLDDNYMPLTIIQSSMGFLKGGPVIRKDFPLHHNLADIPIIIELLGGMLSKTKLWIANDAGPSYQQLGKGPLYSWANFDEVGRWWDPDYKDREGDVTFTTTAEEVSDIQDVAHVLYRGPSNLAEWYFTMRLTVDMTAATAPFGPKYGLNYIHGDHVNDLPKIELIAENGPSSSLFGFKPPEDLPKIKGYNHLDVVTAAADRPGLRRNETFLPVIDFILQPR